MNYISINNLSWICGVYQPIPNYPLLDQQHLRWIDWFFERSGCRQIVQIYRDRGQSISTWFLPILQSMSRGGSRAAATSKMGLFVIIVNDFQPLTIITKCSILDVAPALDPPLTSIFLPYHLVVWRSSFRYVSYF